MSEMTIIERTKRRFMKRPFYYLALATLVLFLIYRFSPSLMTEECDHQCSELLLSFEQYKSPEEFRTKFSSYFRRGDDISDLRKELLSKSDHYWTDKSPTFPELPFYLRVLIGYIWQADFERYEIRVRDSDENTSLWRITLLNRDNTLIKAELLRFFEDEKFSERRMPFRFEDFENGKWAKLAFIDSMSSPVTVDSVFKIHDQLGILSSEFAEPATNLSVSVLGGVYYQSFENYLDPDTQEFLTGGKWILTWSFDAKGTFRNLSVASPSK